jgi:hypothetical protein
LTSLRAGSPTGAKKEVDVSYLVAQALAWAVVLCGKAEVTELDDALGIRDTCGAYVQGYDDRDPEVLGQSLGETCTVDVLGGRFSGRRYCGKADVLDWLGATWPVTPPCLHLTVNHRATIEGSAATGRTNYILVGRAEDGTLRLSGAGSYGDEFKKVKGRWVLESRGVEFLGEAAPRGA